jgi:hypothetical protein
METIIFKIFACVLFLAGDKNLLLENLALRQRKQKMNERLHQASGPVFIQDDDIISFD